MSRASKVSKARKLKSKKRLRRRRPLPTFVIYNFAQRLAARPISEVLEELPGAFDDPMVAEGGVHTPSKVRTVIH
jgi:hypothetical protein